MNPTLENTARLVPFSETDFVAVPAKTLSYRGIQFSRSTILRLRDQGRLKIAPFRFSGSTKGRLYVLRESLDAFIAGQLAEAIGAAE